MNPVIAQKSAVSLCLSLFLLAVAAGQPDKGMDIEVPAKNLTPVSGATLDATSGDLLIKKTGAGFTWGTFIKRPGTYQVWVTYYCGNHDARAKFTLNGQKKEKSLMCMAQKELKRVHDKRYYFREYYGRYKLTKSAEINLVFANTDAVAVHKLELLRERDFHESLEPLLFAGIDFYAHRHVPGRLIPSSYNMDAPRRPISSIATCGVGLMAYTINHQLGRGTDAPEKVLDLLRVCNGKVDGCKPARHRTGFFMHFVDPATGQGRSEYSTIDTSILVSGALIARNAFNDPRITKEADELYNSIDWGAAVVSTDPSLPMFYLKGTQIDGKEKGAITMYNEYILLAWFCQMYENQKKGAVARRHIMPDLRKLPRTVYRNRILLSNQFGGPQPSFLVQFPFYMSELCSDELFFSYTAAQAVADRATNLERHNDRSAWGVAPGCAPSSGYVVDHYGRNEENVMTPRIVAGFIPVYPPAATDLLLRWEEPKNRLKVRFGTILPRFVPGKDWRPNRIAGIDFSCLLLGMAAHHPKVGIEFFQKNTRFTFNQ